MIAETILAAALAVASPAGPATAPADHRPGCRTRACDARVLRRERREAWARRHPWQHQRNRIYRAHPAMRPTLARLRGCETNGLSYPENYRISPGHPRYNGHDGAYQYDRRTWGETYAYLPRRLQRRAHAPAYAASPAEQDVRTALFFPSHRGRWACKA